MVYDLNFNVYADFTSFGAENVKSIAESIKRKYIDTLKNDYTRLYWTDTETKLFSHDMLTFVRPMVSGTGYKYGWLFVLI
ncbi:MAG TPA: hypothetical protein PK733_02950 [Clostridiales bacterium]|nr:hypothetical protein [Clostridiales bacterium]